MEKFIEQLSVKDIKVKSKQKILELIISKRKELFRITQSKEGLLRQCERLEFNPSSDLITKLDTDFITLSNQIELLEDVLNISHIPYQVKKEFYKEFRKETMINNKHETIAARYAE